MEKMEKEKLRKFWETVERMEKEKTYKHLERNLEDTEESTFLVCDTMEGHLSSRI